MALPHSEEHKNDGRYLDDVAHHGRTRKPDKQERDQHTGQADREEPTAGSHVKSGRIVARKTNLRITCQSEPR